MKKLYLLLPAVLFAALSSCSNDRAFTKGDYTEPDKVILLDDRYNESDMKIMADALVASMINHPLIKDADHAPVMQVETVTNSTSEHIDMKSLTDKIRTALIKTGKVAFHNKEERKTVSDEYDYQSASGNVDPSKAANRGRQVGAELILTGDFASHVQELGGRKVVYYKLTLNLTELKTNLIRWSDDKEIKKLFKKQSYAM